MAVVRMSLALDSNKKLVHISEVENGKKCNCVCLECGSTLIASNKGKKQKHHFKHAVEHECQGESVIHRAAKQMIRKKKEIVLPAYRVKESKTDSRGIAHIEEETIVKDSEVIDFDFVQEEVELHGIRADILAGKRNESLIIEVFYRHKVDDQKRLKIIGANISAIEINLSDLKQENIKDLAIFWSYIIDPKRIFWLHNSRDATKRAELKQRLTIKIQEQEEKYKQEEIEKQKQAGKQSDRSLSNYNKQYWNFPDRPYLSRRGPRIEWEKPRGNQRLGNQTFGRKKK